MYRTASKTLLGIIVISLFLSDTAQAFQRFKKEDPKFLKNGTRVQIYRLTVSPAPPPKPLLKYRLKVPITQQIPGNSAPFFLRAHLEKRLDNVAETLQTTEDREEDLIDELGWGEKNIKDVEEKALKEFAKKFDYFVTHYFRPASRQTHCDWGTHPAQIPAERHLDSPLSFATSGRTISQFLIVRARYAIHQKDYETAVEMFRIAYRLRDDIAHSHYLVGVLNAYACDEIVHHVALEMISKKDAPNLYFAMLDRTPNPNHLRDALEVDHSRFVSLHPVLVDIKNKKLTNRQWNRAYGELIRSMLRPKIYRFGETEEDSDPKLAPLVLGVVALPNARKRLIDRGYTESQLEKMPAARVLLLDFESDLRSIAEEHEVLGKLPNANREKLQQALIKKYSPKAQFGRLAALGVREVLESLSNIQNTEKRVEWLNGSLKVIESLRLHAAEHGEFPEKLSDLKWPVPNNPFNNKPYQYRRKNGVAILELPAGFANFFAYRYEIKLDKSK